MTMLRQPVTLVHDQLVALGEDVRATDDGAQILDQLIHVEMFRRVARKFLPDGCADDTLRDRSADNVFRVHYEIKIVDCPLRRVVPLRRDF